MPGTVSQLLDHPLQISLQHKKSKKLTASDITLRSPVGERADELKDRKVGEASWSSWSADGQFYVKLDISLDENRFKQLGYKRKPGRDEARMRGA